MGSSSNSSRNCFRKFSEELFQEFFQNLFLFLQVIQHVFIHVLPQWYHLYFISKVSKDFSRISSKDFFWNVALSSSKGWSRNSSKYCSEISPRIPSRTVSEMFQFYSLELLQNVLKILYKLFIIWQTRTK